MRTGILFIPEFLGKKPLVRLILESWQTLSEVNEDVCDNLFTIRLFRVGKNNKRFNAMSISWITYVAVGTIRNKGNLIQRLI